jgi:hypothetical protein
MAINLSTLSGKLARTEVEFMGQTTKVMYDPMYLTAENMGKAQNGSDAEFVEFFTKAVKSWEVRKANKPVPINEKSLMTVPLVFLRAIFHAMLQEAEASDEGKASNSG